MANGQEFHGPVNIARKSTLGEVSFVFWVRMITQVHRSRPQKQMIVYPAIRNE